MRWPKYLSAFLGTTMAVLMAVILVDMMASPVDTGRGLVVLAIVILDFWVALRMWRCGVFATGKGILVRGLLFSRTVPWDRIFDLVYFPVDELPGGTAYHVVAIRYLRYKPRYISIALPPVRHDAKIRVVSLWALATMTESGAIRMAERITRLIADNYPEPQVQGVTRV